MPFRRGALASEATFLTPAHQPKTEKKRERKRQRADRAGVGEKSQRRVADYPLHRLSNQPVFQTEIPPTASVQRTDRAKKKALLHTTQIPECSGERRRCKKTTPSLHYTGLLDNPFSNLELRNLTLTWKRGEASRWRALLRRAWHCPGVRPG